MVMKSLSSLRDCTTRASKSKSLFGITSRRSRSSCENMSFSGAASLHFSYSACFQTASLAASASPPAARDMVGGWWDGGGPLLWWVTQCRTSVEGGESAQRARWAFGVSKCYLDMALDL